MDFSSCDYRICLESGSYSHRITNLNTKHENSTQTLSEKQQINKIDPLDNIYQIYHIYETKKHNLFGEENEQ